MEQNDHVSIQIATISEQVSGLKSRFEVVERKIDELVVVGSTIRELEVHRENDAADRRMLWKKIEEVNDWRPAQERRESDNYISLVETLEKNSKSFTEACNTLEVKVDSWINKFKGAFWILGILWFLFQGLVAWYFISTSNGINDIRERVSKVENHQQVEDAIRERIYQKLPEIK